ncbi:MAG: hypothetical protein JZU47_04090 [Prolixibacteraceae bacterium]|nr:hypothetical protein [Prolixibacteraceae bacterium]
MRRNNLFGIAMMLVVAFVIHLQTTQAQTPNQFKYQAVLRDASGNIITSQQKSVVIDILLGSATGTSVFTETHDITTTAQGIINLNIGSINTTGISTINWASNTYFIKITVGGVQMGTSQLLSVPYALHAKSSDYNNLVNKPNIITTPSTPKAGDILYFDGLNWLTLPKGANGKTLRIDNEMPNWAEPGYALPIVNTVVVTDLTTTSAIARGNIISTGFTNITDAGICWAESQNPTINDSKISSGASVGTYLCTIKDLKPNTTYNLRAYATNGAGTNYGHQIVLKTYMTVVFPTVTTAAAINISENAAVSGGNVTETGGGVVTAKGICWGTNQNPTIADNKTIDGDGTGQFSSQMSNLVQGTTYYVRAYASNSSGTGYGSQVNFVTLKTIPTIVTKNVTSISPMGGVSGGTITISGGGTISDKGICWGESENPTVNDNKISAGTGIAAFNSAINMLKPNTTCYVRAYARNEIGLAYGEQKTFKTLDAFYDGFETGFSGTTGGWGITTSNAVEGAYSLYTNIGGSEASLKRTLANSGQISFYAKVLYEADNITFYIDNVAQGSYSNSFWGLQSYPVTSGEHTFKWKSNRQCCPNLAPHDAWIDFIVMPK